MLTKPKLRYKKPEIITVKGKASLLGGLLRRSNKRLIKYVLPEGREFYSRKLDLTNGQELQWELYKAGVPVEIPFEEKVKGKSKLMGYFGHGEKISLVRDTISEKQKTQIAKQMIDILTELHKRQITHNHPHSGNWVIDKKGIIRLIDFKLAQRKIILWNKPESIFFGFHEDYRNLRSAFVVLRVSNSAIKYLFGMLIKNYPASEQVKQEVFQTILNELPIK